MFGFFSRSKIFYWFSTISNESFDVINVAEVNMKNLNLETLKHDLFAESLRRILDKLIF